MGPGLLTLSYVLQEVLSAPNPLGIRIVQTFVIVWCVILRPVYATLSATQVCGLSCADHMSGVPTRRRRRRRRPGGTRVAGRQPQRGGRGTPLAGYRPPRDGRVRDGSKRLSPDSRALGTHPSLIGRVLRTLLESRDAGPRFVMSAWLPSSALGR